MRAPLPRLLLRHFLPHNLLMHRPAARSRFMLFFSFLSFLAAEQLLLTLAFSTSVSYQWENVRFFCCTLWLPFLSCVILFRVNATR